MPASHTRNAYGAAARPLDEPVSEPPDAAHSVVVAQPEERTGDAAALLASGARFVRGLLRSRLGLILTAAVVVAAGLALGWEWLAVAGVLPLVLSVLPCVAMCALGLCMVKGGNGQSCSSQQDSGSPAGVKPPADRL